MATFKASNQLWIGKATKDHLDEHPFADRVLWLEPIDELDECKDEKHVSRVGRVYFVTLFILIDNRV